MDSLKFEELATWLTGCFVLVLVPTLFMSNCDSTIRKENLKAYAFSTPKSRTLPHLQLFKFFFCQISASSL